MSPVDYELLLAILYNITGPHHNTSIFSNLSKCVYAIKIVNIKYEVRCGLLLCIFMLLCNFRGLLDQ